LKESKSSFYVFITSAESLPYGSLGVQERYPVCCSPISCLSCSFYTLPCLRKDCDNGGGEGAGDPEKRGREVYGRGEKMWLEAGEKGKNYATLRNISQSKKCKKYRVGTGIKGFKGKREV